MIERTSPERALADAAITAERHETKYLLAQEHRVALKQMLDRHLSLHHYRGEGENPLPWPEHFVTTVYFDTPDRSHFRAARENGDQNLKLRAKEYYDLHPSLAELATDVSEVLHQPAWLWLELKMRSGTQSSKHRIRLPRTLVPEWIAGRVEPDAQTCVAGRAGDAEALRDYCSRLSLAPTCVVNYRRASFQSPDSRLRVTLDTDLCFYPVPSELWSRRSLNRAALGRPRLREPQLLLEVKHRQAEIPAWLGEALAAAGAVPVNYSKFVRAAEAVLADD